jgi:plasminogen activator
MKKTKWLMTLAIMSTTSQAISATYTNDRLSLNGSIGYLAGKSQEYVYDRNTGHKISQLNWRIKGDAVIKGEANYKLRPWLDANAQGWITLATGKAVMDDYDWLVPGQRHWSHWSHHNDTDLRQGNEFDLSLRAWFLQKPNYQLAGLIGYQRTLFSFLAKGGCYNYDNGNSIGCFADDEKGIGYKQTFKTPYLGIAGKYLVNAFEINGLFKFSNEVNARDVDQHFQRNLTFKEGSNQFKFYNLTVNTGYHVKPHIKLFAEGDFNYFPHKKTSTSIRDNSSGEMTFEGSGSSGLNNKYLIISLGVQYTGMAG